MAKKKNFDESDFDKLINENFDNVYDMSKDESKVDTWYDSGVYALNYTMSKNLFGGYPKGRVIGIDGLSGCLHENTIIKINRGKRTHYREYTIKDLYERFHNKAIYGGRQWDKKIPTKTFSYKEDNDSIGYNEIEDVIYSGVKKTFSLKTETGKSIIATAEHPFKVPKENINGRGNPEKDNFVPLQELKIGDSVFVKSKPSQNVNFGGKKKGRREVFGVEYHPYAWIKKVDIYSYKRIHYSRLVVEAELNNLPIEKYINILKYNQQKSKELKYLSPSLVVHHKDGDVKNDSIENLEVLTKQEYDSYHAIKKTHRGFGHNEYHTEKIVSIVPFGEAETYDIRMKKPYSNFIANDFIVHNTGKSLLAATMLRDPKIDYVVVLETEGGGNSKELIDFAGVDTSKTKVKTLKANTISSYRIKKKTGEVEEVTDDKFPKKKETDEYLYVEGAGLLLRKFANLVKYNKIEKNIVIILDSLGNLQSVRGLSGGHDMGRRGVDLTNFFKNFDNEFEKAGLTFVFTNKLYQSLNPNGPSHVQSGGESPIYNSSLYLRLSETQDTDDISESDMKKEKEQRRTALGSSIKTIKAKVKKSRFGTEMREVPFLLDFSVGPVRYSGLFRLLKDFGIVKRSGGAYYELPEMFDKKFMKKDFISMIQKNEKENLEKIQELLTKREAEIKEQRKKLQVSDEEELEEKIEEESEEEFNEEDTAEMKNQMIKDLEE